METPAEANFFLLPGSSADAPYGVVNGKPRRQPTRQQVQFLQKQGIDPKNYGWKAEARAMPPERAEKLRENLANVHAGGRAYAEKRRQKMAEMYGDDWFEKGHRVSELKVVKKVEPNPNLPPAMLEIPVKNRPRTSVGKKVAAAASEVAKTVDAWKTENSVALKALVESVQAAHGAAVQANERSLGAQKEAASVREELARIRAAAESASKTIVNTKQTSVPAVPAASGRPSATTTPVSDPGADGRPLGAQRPRSAEPARTGSLW